MKSEPPADTYDERPDIKKFVNNDKIHLIPREETENEASKYIPLLGDEGESHAVALTLLKDSYPLILEDKKAVKTISGLKIIKKVFTLVDFLKEGVNRGKISKEEEIDLLNKIYYQAGYKSRKIKQILNQNSEKILK